MGSHAWKIFLASIPAFALGLLSEYLLFSLMLKMGLSWTMAAVVDCRPGPGDAMVDGADDSDLPFANKRRAEHGGSGMKQARQPDSMPTKPTVIPAALVGTWITEDEDSDAAFTLAVKKNRLDVSGFCRSDGEPFEIEKVKWDGKVLSFVARMGSTLTNSAKRQEEGRSSKSPL